LWSGTVGAAREGTMLGIMSVAFSPSSSKSPDFEGMSHLAVKIVRQVLHKGLPDKVFLNVTFPNRNKKVYLPFKRGLLVDRW